MSTNLRTTARAAFIFAAGIFVIALLSGLLWEQAQRTRDRERFPQVGHSVDIGGRTLNIECSGTGRPAVILAAGATWPIYPTPKAMFEDGAPRPGYSWVRIQSQLAKSTTTCWYDRAGSGWSDLGPYPRDSAAQANDLHALLQAAGVPPPYVLVAESSAALDARVFTGLYPDAVAGLVLVDGVPPDFFGATRGGGRAGHFPGFVGHTQDAAAQLFNQVGLYRLAGRDQRLPPPLPPEITAPEWSTIWHLTQSAKARSALIQDIASWQQSAAEARSVESLGDRLLIVLTSARTPVAPQHRALWMEMQADLARLSSRGKQILVSGSDGDLMFQAPRSIIDAVGVALR
jgi:pimeloyl-ACP methyl ester carboxylesterase